MIGNRPLKLSVQVVLMENARDNIRKFMDIGNVELFVKKILPAVERYGGRYVGKRNFVHLI
jgi:hypothetical protein